MATKWKVMDSWQFFIKFYEFYEKIHGFWVTFEVTSYFLHFRFSDLTRPFYSSHKQYVFFIEIETLSFSFVLVL